MVKRLRPEEIEQESFRIIEEEMGEHTLSHQEFRIVQRVIHTSADFEFAELLHFSDGFFEAVKKSFDAKHSLVTDTNMILSGISKPSLKKVGLEARCYIADADIAEAAKKSGDTRARLSMQKAAEEGAGGIVIGNAPTALRSVIELSETTGWRPDFVIGIPVGFVDAAESKDALMGTDIPHISIKGRKGGSTISVAIVNALLKLYISGEL